ncbi:hypothetical protein TPHA_0D04030 [Tetrapisispora phaffii CBS 4417]|uniref:FMP27 GFWDK domain-containing protein n=1 Tax=Tetrapisispora phaffii (strain ATCC 24235 / CBS 4417 / NBRC 1672 / NRRL Y-8282 / UCD 70-5) TaxID=1071381 RepID=G8BT65_TETPH|nr:hypothetical protein TPHA_0D04030 [Tetrapisispora phaffii CBS 4417]CCE63036.1 hypothetical protein TPHA_0D04030 [Tetrapisispora phaffii CBS 4417]
MVFINDTLAFVEKQLTKMVSTCLWVIVAMLLFQLLLNLILKIVIANTSLKLGGIEYFYMGFFTLTSLRKIHIKTNKFSVNVDSISLEFKIFPYLLIKNILIDYYKPKHITGVNEPEDEFKKPFLPDEVAISKKIIKMVEWISFSRIRIHHLQVNIHDENNPKTQVIDVDTITIGLPKFTTHHLKIDLLLYDFQSNDKLDAIKVITYSFSCKLHQHPKIPGKLLLLHLDWSNSLKITDVKMHLSDKMVENMVTKMVETKQGTEMKTDIKNEGKNVFVKGNLSHEEIESMIKSIICPYKVIIENLKVIDIKFENITFKNDFLKVKISISSTQVRLQAITDISTYNELLESTYISNNDENYDDDVNDNEFEDDTSKQEILNTQPIVKNTQKSKFEDIELSLSFNSIHLSVNNKSLIRIPIINMLVTTDLMLYFLKNSHSYNDFKISFSINILNPTLFISVDMIQKMAEYLNNTKTDLAKGNDSEFNNKSDSISKQVENNITTDENQLIEQINIDKTSLKNILEEVPSFLIELNISNFNIYLQISNDESINLKIYDIKLFLINNYTVITKLKNSSKIVQNKNELFEQLPIKDPLTKDLNSFFKIINVSLAYKKNNTLSTAEVVPIYQFERYVVILDNLSPEKITSVATLRKSDFTLLDIEVLGKLINTYSVLKEYSQMIKSSIRKTKSKSVKKKIIFSIEWSAKLRVKDMSFSVLISNYLPALLDPCANDDGNLSDVIRGFTLVFHESIFEASNVQRQLSIAKIELIRVMDHCEAKNICDDVFKLGNLSFTDKYDDVLSKCIHKVRVPEVYLKFDVNLIWIIFYLKKIYADHVTLLRSKKRKIVSKADKPSNSILHLSFSKVIFDVNLPENVSLFFDIKDIYYSNHNKKLKILNILGYVRSVYVHDLPVNVELLNIKNMVFCSNSHTEGKTFIVDTELIRLRTEYHFKFYEVVNNIISTFKSYKQLAYSFSDLSGFHRFHPKVENPKKIPTINIRAKKFLIDVEEDPFEQELGLIFKIGVLEQRERLAKLEEFEEQKSILREFENFNNNNNVQPDHKQNTNSFENLAKQRLYELFSTSWISRHRTAKLKFHGMPYHIKPFQEFDKVYYRFTGKATTTVANLVVKDLDMTLKQPSFPVENFFDFIHEMGKGVPKSMSYTILILLGIDIKTKLWQLKIRDYPVPVITIPDTRTTGDLVFAEKMPGDLALRTTFVPFVPSATLSKYAETSSIYGSHVIGTMNSIKTYFNIHTKVTSNSGTNITWGKSFQPGYQSLMMWFDFLTKPQMDPSPKLGFWDKFRFLVHGSWRYEFGENSDLRLNIKGAHNPYKITDDGAGLSFCWSGGTILNINGENNPREFLLINSASFKLVVPDFTDENKFDKILMNLEGGVKWTLGLLFEEGKLALAGDEKRSTPVRPHYDVTLINPKYVYNREDYDSWRGFRSNFIHMSFGIYSGKDASNNNIYLAPYTMSHFFKWWNLFDTYTSGPIRQGPLFPNMIQNNNKFGRSLFTIKYQLYLAPLTITHIYRHATSEDDKGIHSSVKFTGIKCKTKSLKIDLHQKRIKLTHTNEKLNKSKPVWKLRMSKGEVDCEEADYRLISTTFDDANIEKTIASRLGLRCKKEKQFASENINSLKDSEWYDINDYVDLNQISLEAATPIKIDIKPFVSTPRITYFRKINDEGYDVRYPFGAEPSHRCIIGKNHPERTQEHLANQRSIEIQGQISELQQKISEIDKLSEMHPDDNDITLKKNNLYAKFSNILTRYDMIDEILSDLKISESLPLDGDLHSNFNESMISADLNSINDNNSLLRVNTLNSFVSMRRGSTIEAKSTYDNRFMIHNVTIKIDNDIKNHLLEYASSSSERRSTQFYCTYKSVTIVKELLDNFFANTIPAITEYGLLNNDETCTSTEFIERFDELTHKLPNENYDSIDSYLIQLISPQVQITSECEPDTALLITATEIETGIIDVMQIMSKSGKIIDADVNTIVESRYCSVSKELQVFTLFKKDIPMFQNMGLLVPSEADKSQSLCWVPWLPLELCFDGSLLDEHMILKRRSLFLRYTSPNPLFVSDNAAADFSKDSRVDIGFPNLVITCTSQQYNSVYNIAHELMSLGTSMDEKADKLSKLLLADEVRNNLEKLDISVVVNLQRKLRELYYTREFLKTYDTKLYKSTEQELTLEIQATQLELSVLMSAVKRNYDSIGSGNNSRKLLNWKVSTDELIWELSDSNNRQFITIGLGPSSFVRSQTADGSNSNVISIQSLQIYNQQQKLVYQQLIAPFEDNPHYTKDMPMLEIFWLLSSPVGGISVLEEMIVSFQPIIFRMDHITADKLMNYLFPKNETADSAGARTLVREHHTAQMYNTSEANSETQSSSPVSPVSERSGADSITSGKTTTVREMRKVSSTFIRPTEESINEMVKRSGTYINIKSVTIKKMMMSISYKGAHSVLTNVDDLIVKVPTLQYHNKIWSREELFSAIKKDVIMVVLQHTGNIIGNKFIPHKKENKKKVSLEISKLLKSGDDKKNAPSKKSSYKIDHHSFHTSKQKPPVVNIIIEEDEDGDEIKAFYPNDTTSNDG